VDSSRYGLPAGQVIDHKPRKRNIFQFSSMKRNGSKAAYASETDQTEAHLEYTPAKQERRERPSK
jgi:hypothetical protein